MKFASALIFGSILSLSLLPAQEPGFVPLFNGTDLTGWRPVNVAPDTFSVREGMIVTSGKPTGFMATEKVYENFVIELDWRHMKEAGNSGLFIWGEGLPAPGVPYARGIEVQILDLGYEKNSGAWEWFTSHGDIFPIWGATMTPQPPVAKKGSRAFPSERRVKPSPEWNHYKVTCNAGEIRLEVNGKEVTVGKNCVPRKGFICLESEGSEAHFKNIFIKELPATGATAEQTAKLYPGFKQLVSGKDADFTGWKTTAEIKSAWTIDGLEISPKPKLAGANLDLVTEKSYRDFTLVLDCKFKTRPSASLLTLRNSPQALASIAATAKPGAWNRFIISVKGQQCSVLLNDQPLMNDVPLPDGGAEGPVVLHYQPEAIQFANLFIAE